MVLSSAVTGSASKCLMLLNASRAYMFAPTGEDTYVDVCSDAQSESDQGMLEATS